jgi:hypothetical protein
MIKIKYIVGIFFFIANKTITAGPDNIIVAVAINCPKTLPINHFKSLFINFNKI